MDDVRLEQRSLVDLAVAEVQRLIQAGVYSPGERLLEEQLSDQLGISRPPLREALRELAQRGIVEQLPRRGARVVKFTEREVIEIYSLREALERFAVELAFPNPNPEAIVKMHEALEVMRKAADDEDHGEVVRSNRDYHIALVSLANHSRLLSTYEGLMDQMQLCMSENLRSENQLAGDYQEGVRRHEVLLKAIEYGDLEAVLVALAEHGERGSTPRPPSGHGGH